MSLEATTSNCPICEVRSRAFFHQKIQSKFYHCPECHFIFKDSSSYMSLEEEHKHYAKHNNSIENEGYVAMFQDFMQKTLLKAKDGTKNVLEFGSGPGPVLSELLRREGFEVDIYDKFFAPKKVYEGKLYDAITSTEVIEHISDPLSIMQFFNAHLKVGGVLCLMTQFHSNIIDEFLTWWYCRDLTHISFFRVETFEVLAKRTGFEVEYSDNVKVVYLHKRRDI